MRHKYPSFRYIFLKQSANDVYRFGSSGPLWIWNLVFIRSSGCISDTSTKPDTK